MFFLFDRESVLLGSVDAIDWVLRFCFRVSNSLNRSFIYCCSDPGKRLNPYGIIVGNVDVEKPSLTD
ncbi:BnaC04g26060D [Brassica napus]|uniref:BnaC04g26060D protein n=2 Tax=Brassica napus TaxID=3708 RepID=A0A078FJU5_BRANA|nr:BnaC04g26060D [Brassica napus]